MEDIARVVPALSPETLQKVIAHSGLDATLPLLSLATSMQLHQVMDIDLWRAASPGLDDGFDVSRFGEWLESLVDIDEEFGAVLLARMEPTLIVGGLSSLVRVFDLATLPSQPELDVTDPRKTGGLPSADVGRFRVVFRDSTAPWDAVVSVLTALESQHPQLFQEVMTGCRRLSNEGFERDGLDNLLDDRQQAWLDQQGRRLVRREHDGYVSPADARAFLSSARQVRFDSPSEPGADPTWESFLHSTVDRSRESTRVNDSVEPASAAHDHRPERDRTAEATSTAPAQDAVAHAEPARPVPVGGPPAHDLASVVQLLESEGIVSATLRGLLPAGQTAPSRYTCIHSRMQHVFERDHDAFERRNLELTFLASVVASGCPVHQRSLTPTEATEAATAVCSLGLEAWPRAWTRSKQEPAVHPPIDILQHSSLIVAFQLGWRTLYDTVSTHAAKSLLRVLAGFTADGPLKAEVRELRRNLTRCLKDGEPWKAADELDVVASMDLPAWATLIGLIAEFPVMHPVLTIEPGRRILSVDPLAFSYFSEPEHLLLAHRFLDSLAERLAS